MCDVFMTIPWNIIEYTKNTLKLNHDVIKNTSLIFNKLLDSLQKTGQTWIPSEHVLYWLHVSKRVTIVVKVKVIKKS